MAKIIPVDMDLDKPTSYGASAVAVYQALSSYGVDAMAALRQVGIDSTLLNNPNQRLEVELWKSWVRKAIELSGDPAFGLRVADFIHPTSYQALSVALLSSSTLRAFFARWVRYYSFITTNETVSVEEYPEGLALTFCIREPLDDDKLERSLIEGSVAVAVKFIRFMYQPAYEPAKVSLIWPPVEGRQADYRKYLSSNLEFSAQRNAIYIDYAEAELPLPAASAEMARKNDQVVAQFLARMERSNVPAQVHAKLIELLPSGDCSKALVADSLYMSVRTLHNKLARAKTNYQELLDRTRQQLAEQYMNERDISVSDAAYLLGFSDCSNFCRAFHRWTKLTPSEFRQHGSVTGSEVNKRSSS